MNNIKKPQFFKKLQVFIFLFILIFIVIVFSINFYRQYTHLQHNAKIVEKTVLDNKKQELKQEVERLKRMIQSKQEKIENRLKTNIKIRVDQAYEIALNTYIYQNQKNLL